MAYRETLPDGTVRLTGGEGPGKLIRFKANRFGGSGLVTPVAFPGLIYNEGNAAWDGTNYTIPVDGYYDVFAHLKGNSTSYGSNIGLEKSTDGGTTWVGIAWSYNNPTNAYGGSFVEHSAFFTKGTKLRVKVNGTWTLVDDSPNENAFFTVSLASWSGKNNEGIRQSPNIVSVQGATGNPTIAQLSISVQEQSKIKLTGFVTAYSNTTGYKTVTATVNGVTSVVGSLYFNEISSHKVFALNGVLGPLPAGTYVVTLAFTGGLTPDANDPFNVTLEEKLPGGWSPPTLLDSGRIYVGAGGAAPFVGGWVNFDGTGATWERAFYHSIGKQTMIGGLVYNSTTAYASGQVIFTLPAGFRPPEDLHVGVQNGANAVCRINIMRNGDVKLNYSSAATAAGPSGWWSLANIVFPNAV
jgi:hypothetical protein